MNKLENNKSVDWLIRNVDNHLQNSLLPLHPILKVFKEKIDQSSINSNQKIDLASKIKVISERKLNYYNASYFGFIIKFFSCLQSVINFGVFKTSAELGIELANRILSQNLPLTEKNTIKTDKLSKVTVEKKTQISTEPTQLYSIQMTEELKEYNLKLRQFESKWIELNNELDELMNQLDKVINNKDLSTVEIQKRQEEINTKKKQINQEKDHVREQYKKILLEKMVYVKRVYPDNPVYAMANPCKLDPGTKFYTASKDENKINDLLGKGFVWEQSKPATAYGLNYTPGRWGINEMGEKGFYFSKDIPAYLSYELPVALECVLNDFVNGVSIMSVTELKAVGFSEIDIEKGYQQLQQEYAFLQHDGLYPKDTEVVFMRSENKLKPIHVLIEEVDIKVFTISNYYSTIKKPEPTLHKSWIAG